MTTVSFMVVGDPAPQGSKRAFVNRYTGRAALVESSSRVKPWRADVREAATVAWQGPPTTAPVSLALFFTFPRPKSHYRSNGELKPSAPGFKAQRPDIDKLVRSTLDALTGIVIADDAQVVDLTARKEYVGSTVGQVGCYVIVTTRESGG